MALVVGRLGAHSAAVSAMCVPACDPARVLTAGWDGHVRLWWGRGARAPPSPPLPSLPLHSTPLHSTPLHSEPGCTCEPAQLRELNPRLVSALSALETKT